MEFILLPSPNFDERLPSVLIDTLVIHYTGMQSKEAALAQLTSKEAKVSSHYLIDEQGEITQLVKDEQRAWHAGKSIWRGRERVNDVSIGIELVNPGHEFGYRPFPSIQMEALLELCLHLQTKHSIPARNIVGHSDIAIKRKIDPGELFDWKWLASKGVGLWPDISVTDSRKILEPGNVGQEVAILKTNLKQYGYGIEVNMKYDEALVDTVIAFRRHFLPDSLHPYWDARAEAVLEALLDL